MSALRVLMLEDHPEEAELLALALRRGGVDCDWTRVDTREAFLAGLTDRPDVVLADYSLPGFTAIDALTMMAHANAEIPVIVVTGVMSDEACVESLRRGAIDYLQKDRLARLGSAVDHALAEQAMRVRRRDAERAAQQLSAMLSGVVNNSPSAIYVKGRDGRYLIANRRLEELLGAHPGGVVGRTDFDLLPAQTAEALASLDRRCWERDEPDQREVELGSADRRRVYLSIRYPVHTGDGAVGGIYTDVTAMKDVESRLRAARAELRQQAARLEQDNLDLRELDRVKAEFLESVSHELRTPLAAIKGTTEMLIEGDFGRLGPREREMVAAVERAGNRLYSTISDLLTVFQMDRGGFELNLRPTQLADVIRRTVTVLEPTFAAAGIAVSVEVAPALPVVAVDGDQIGRVLVNLLTNAIKFSSPGHSVTVSAEADRHEVVVRVHDTGGGIPQAEQARVFLQFRRGTKALREAAPGVGLGLAIAREIVERHHGWIDLESKEGRGTTVTFGLPRQPAPATPPMAPEPGDRRVS